MTLCFSVTVRERGGVSRVRSTDAVLLLVAAVWGSSYLAAKTATSALPVLLVLFARYGISAAACLLVVALGKGAGRCTRDELRLGSVLGVTQAAILVLETYGVAHTSAANAGLIISLTVVLTPSSTVRRVRRDCPLATSPRPACASWPSGSWCRATASTSRAPATC